MVLHGNAHLWPQAEPIQQMQQIESFPPRAGFLGGLGRINPLVSTGGGENLEKAGKPKKKLAGGFKQVSIFTPKIGEDFQIDEHIFQMGGKKNTNEIFVT